jgi:hypothetical protein
MRRLAVFLLLAAGTWLLLHALAAAKAPPLGPPGAFKPDPRSVQRYGPAYRYPQAGWVVLHIEGEPYARGCQHGRLLAPEIAAHVRCFAAVQSPKAPAEGWKLTRTLANALFLRRYAKEYLEEMKGIADGASAAGATFDGRPLDLLDVVALNSWPEIDTLDSALRATPDGLEGMRFPLDAPRPAPRPKPMHCSAFAATGPATADGKVVFGHITMFALYPSLFYNVWLDVKPAKGHRVLMQTYPGGIQSGLDYYLNDKGILVCETTLAQTRFDPKGAPVASRIRQALQYADSIDKVVAILEKDNNGLYTNEWLLADVKTNEIALFALGTHKSKLYRSSKDQWFGGTKGFYWGCNNTKDLEVRLETIASVEGRPAGAVFVPSDRDRKWLELYDRYKGKIDANFGRVAFTTPPLAAFHSLDAKFTTTDLAKNLETWALFGPPLGRTWQPTFAERKRFPEVTPLVSNPWTVLHARPPGPSGSTVAAVDLHDPLGKKKAPKAEDDKAPPTVPAWHGTLLPKADADVWLATAFPAYERYVATERALRKRGAGKLRPADRDRLEVALFAYRAQYELGARARPEAALAKTRVDLRHNDWHKVAQGKGVLLLHALRGRMGDEAFGEMMDAFGRAHAGKAVTAAQFQAHVGKWPGGVGGEFFEPWLTQVGLPPPGRSGGGPFSVLTFYAEVEQTLIVYGTGDELPTNREAASALRQALRRRGANVTMRVKSDREVTPAELKGHHLLLIGRPDSNSVVARCRDVLPLTFGARSFVVRGETFAHAGSAVLAAAESPFNKRFSVVVIAGLGAASTRRAAPKLGDRSLSAGEVVLLPHGGKPRALVLPAREVGAARPALKDTPRGRE